MLNPKSINQNKAPHVARVEGVARSGVAYSFQTVPSLPQFTVPRFFKALSPVAAFLGMSGPLNPAGDVSPETQALQEWFDLQDKVKFARAGYRNWPGAAVAQGDRRWFLGAGDGEWHGPRVPPGLWLPDVPHDLPPMVLPPARPAPSLDGMPGKKVGAQSLPIRIPQAEAAGFVLTATPSGLMVRRLMGQPGGEERPRKNERKARYITGAGRLTRWARFAIRQANRVSEVGDFMDAFMANLKINGRYADSLSWSTAYGGLMDGSVSFDGVGFMWDYALSQALDGVYGIGAGSAFGSAEQVTQWRGNMAHKMDSRLSGESNVHSSVSTAIRSATDGLRPSWSFDLRP